MSEILRIRPYARLITMLGDQLIKNERIALVELIKNAYDADAEWVKVSFVNFNNDFTVNANSKIIIEDNGNGMNREIIEKHWLNPATPEKIKRKRVKSVTDKGRIIQGEKGIGRFAIFKLGKRVTICTRRRLQDTDGKLIDGGEAQENIVFYDFTGYDENFSSKEDGKRELFIDELQVAFQQRVPVEIVEKKIELGNLIKDRSPYGTIIEISALKTNWTQKRVRQIQTELGKLQPIFSEEEDADFHVWIYKDNELYRGNELYKEKLLNCLNHKAVFRITEGYYDESEQKFRYQLNGVSKELSFSDLKGLDAFRSYFRDGEGNVDVHYRTECGNFRFQFYIFDFVASDTKYILDETEEKMVKEHRIYLYRDRVRVLPYGDPDDDWLRIDMLRGTKSAGYYLSNDQVVGCVDISQKENPKLKDKTNREGLIDEGRALEDFTNLLQVLLRYFRKIEYAKYLIDKKKRKQYEDEKNGKPLDIIKDVKKKAEGDKTAQKLIESFEKSYQQERKVYNDRIRTTENLAAVGLSVETASHDVMIVLKKALDQLHMLIDDLKLEGEVDKPKLLTQMQSLESSMNLVNTQMQDIRLLFPSAKTRAKNISVCEILEKVKRLYQRPFDKYDIDLKIMGAESDLFIKATEAVLLQVFINLFDNALYWLNTIDGQKQILILIDPTENTVLFADNGPGIKEESKGYIFEAFYSEKGKDGRGLGLYIARQLLDRYDYDIILIEDQEEKILPGANFCIRYMKEEG